MITTGKVSASDSARKIQQAVNFALVNVLSGALLLVWVAYVMLTRSLVFGLLSLAVVPVMIAAGTFGLIAYLAGNLEDARREIEACELDLLAYTDVGMHPFLYFLAFSRLAPVQALLVEAFARWQAGQTQPSGMSSKAVPGAMPASGSPAKSCTPPGTRTTASPSCWMTGRP